MVWRWWPPVPLPNCRAEHCAVVSRADQLRDRLVRAASRVDDVRVLQQLCEIAEGGAAPSAQARSPAALPSPPAAVAAVAPEAVEVPEDNLIEAVFAAPGKLGISFQVRPPPLPRCRLLLGFGTADC